MCLHALILNIFSCPAFFSQAVLILRLPFLYFVISVCSASSHLLPQHRASIIRSVADTSYCEPDEANVLSVIAERMMSTYILLRSTFVIVLIHQCLCNGREDDLHGNRCCLIYFVDLIQATVFAALQQESCMLHATVVVAYYDIYVDKVVLNFLK